MRRKRLNHSAETLCAMFCGWRLMNSYAELVALGSGQLEIDALHLKCRFNGQEVEPVSMAHELHQWLQDDLRQHHIDPEALGEATLNVALELSTGANYTVSGGSFYIGKDGKPIEGGQFYKLVAICTSKVSTDEATYEASRRHIEQWPVSWPQS